MLHIEWKHLYARHCAYTKLLSLHQRSDTLRWQMTYERQQSRRQQKCTTCFGVVAFDITKRVLRLELTSSPSPGRAECRTGPVCPVPGSARRRFPNNSKQASLAISSSNGYSSMVPFTGKLAVHLRAVRMQCLLRCADSKTHARSHSTVPWGLVVRASLSSQSKSNSGIPKEACLSDWRGFPPCLVTTGGLKEMDDPISFCSYGRCIVFCVFCVLCMWGSEMELGPDVCASAWETMNQKMPSQLDFSFAVLAGRAEGHRD